MPFTFSHPAIILPLNYLPKKWFSMTGLIIGSLTPDFEYFIRMKIKSEYSHTIEGIFWFDLPLGILIAFIFHNIIRNSLYDNLPLFLKSRLSVFKQLNWNYYFVKNWIIVIISIIIGAFSHIFWDSFTHFDGYFVKKIPILSKTVALNSIDVPIVKILQHSSTIIGAFIIGFSIFKIPIHNTEKQNINLKYWSTIIVLIIIIISPKLINGLELHQYGNLIVSVISAFFLSLMITPFLIKNSNKTLRT